KEYIVAGLLYLSNLYAFDLRGKTIGIVGVGNVGKKIVQVAEALNMQVIKSDPPLARFTGDLSFLPFDALADCDIVSLHVPLTQTGTDPTFHLFGDEQFRKLKPGTIFVNTSRGGVVKTDALQNAIRDKRISYSIIDVWENEPFIDQELLSAVTLRTAHIAGHSLEGKINGVKIIREKICKHFSISLPSGPDLTVLLQDPVEVNVPSVGLRTNEEFLHRIVSQCYDIALDDAHLRGLLHLPESQRNGYFQKLRTNYRIRREFSNAFVNLPPQYLPMRSQLTSLGFGFGNP
ncbi:MAG TPA: DUF3410 domain-containing protein, partial [Bacteroidota bacterium]|nr:DUF3410 domain-containing protein [Bacteroidota bacterium]